MQVNPTAQPALRSRDRVVPADPLLEEWDRQVSATVAATPVGRQRLITEIARDHGMPRDMVESFIDCLVRDRR